MPAFHDQAKPVIAVVLGGGGRDALAAQAGVTAKALAPCEGKAMGLHVLEALRDSAYVGDCIYVGPTTPAFAPLLSRSLPAGERLSDSLSTGLTAALAMAEEGQRLLVVTADLPWLTSAAVDHLIANAPPAGLVYPIIPRAAAERQFPQQKRTYVRIKEGFFTGGNLILLQPQTIPTLLPFIDRLYRARKNPLALAAIVGFGTLIKFLFGWAHIADLERRAGQLLKVPARAFITEHASLGADVDKLEHLSAGPALPAGVRWMRRPDQLRLAALLGVAASLVFAVGVAYLLYLILGRSGRLGFEGVTVNGLVEGLGFIVSYSFGLLYVRNGLGVPSPLLLSFGLIAPPNAAKAAAEVPVVDATSGLHTLMETRVVIVEENGVPVGLTGVQRERIAPWDELAKIDGSVAVTELRGLLSREQLVVVTRDKAVLGIITQEMYLAGLWGRVR